MGGREFIVFIGATLLGLGLLMTPLILLCNWGEENQCANQAELMGVEYRYGINTPCMVKINGQFVPLKAFKALQ